MVNGIPIAIGSLSHHAGHGGNRDERGEFPARVKYATHAVIEHYTTTDPPISAKA
jgi:hypothetical protein